MDTWNPPVETSAVEKRLLKLCKKQKLWGFLRHYRHELLNDDVRTALHGMYASSGRGKPRCPERLALALLLQVAFKVADHEVPTLTVVDQRWRMVLDLTDDTGKVAFCQGTVFNFRERARAFGFMRVLLDRTVELARETGGFSHKRLRMLIDSSPLVGAGRVEDTFNLVGRAMGQLVEVAAKEAGRPAEDVAEELQLTVVSAKSVKAALDVDWRLPEARNEALNALLEQFARLRTWLETQFVEEQVNTPPLSDALALVEDLIEQDTEPDPDSPGGGRRIRTGGSNRRVSISDPDMRHGRKSKTKLFTGYKRHASVDADLAPLILGVHVQPANAREYEGARPLLEDAERQGLRVVEAHHDRGYLPSPAIHERRHSGMKVISKPPTPARLGDRLNKADFDIDVAASTVTCPNGRTEPIRWELKKPAANFGKARCPAECPWFTRCQSTKKDRRITLHRHEDLHQQMAAELATPEGRALRRIRTAAEHAMARLAALQGLRARYWGLQKNQFHAEACAVLVNCFVVNELRAAA